MTSSAEAVCTPNARTITVENAALLVMRPSYARINSGGWWLFRSRRTLPPDHALGGTVTGQERRAARRVLALFVVFGALATGCATPIGVDLSTPQAVMEEELQSELTGDRPSAWSRQFLDRLSLTGLYE